MKRICMLSVLCVNILLVGCYSGDDDDGRYVFLTTEDALTIDNQENYVVGDTIFFEVKFSRYLKEEGFDNLLDIYESTDAEEFRYSFGLGKFSNFSDDYENINIASDYLLAEKGTVYRGFYNEAQAVLNREKTQYESRIGIILAETGDFRFDFGYLGIYSESDYDNVIIEIQNNIDPDSLMMDFSVTE